jgi:hypothetical protein
VIRRDIERRPPVACEYVLGHPALVSQLAGRVRTQQRYEQPYIRADASATRLQLIGLPKTRSNNELNCTRCTVLFRIAVYIHAMIAAVLGASSNEASAHCNRNGMTCVEKPITRAKEIDALRHRRHLVARIAPATTGCYGFDNGRPVYSPKPCRFPYNCEMFDGACGHTRPWAHTIDR